MRRRASGRGKKKGIRSVSRGKNEGKGEGEERKRIKGKGKVGSRKVKRVKEWKEEGEVDG